MRWHQLLAYGTLLLWAGQSNVRQEEIPDDVCEVQLSGFGGLNSSASVIVFILGFVVCGAAENAVSFREFTPIKCSFSREWTADLWNQLCAGKITQTVTLIAACILRIKHPVSKSGNFHLAGLESDVRRKQFQMTCKY